MTGGERVEQAYRLLDGLGLSRESWSVQKVAEALETECEAATKNERDQWLPVAEELRSLRQQLAQAEAAASRVRQVGQQQ